MVPAPQFESFDALNAWLEEQCLQRQNDIVIDHVLELVGGQAHRVFVGGIAASLMHDKFIDELRTSY